MAYFAAISAHCPQALQPERTQSRVMASRRSLPRSISRSAIFSDLQAMRSEVIGSTTRGGSDVVVMCGGADRVAAAIKAPASNTMACSASPKGCDDATRIDLRQTVLADRDTCNASSRMIATAWATPASEFPAALALASKSSAARFKQPARMSRPSGVKPRNSIQADCLMASMKMDVDALMGASEACTDVMGRVYGAREIMSNAAKVALPLRPLAGAVNSPVGELVSGFAA